MFADNLAYGAAGESAIARWLRSRGHGVLPVYEKIVDTGKGPQIYMPRAELIAPDLLVFKSDGALWVEAKHKNAFSWHRITNCWVTGIDERHYEHYLRVDRETPWRVWLLFLHEGGQAKDSEPSPSGLFGNTLRRLSQTVNHRSDKWAAGMVYWAIDSLKKLADMEGLR